MTFPAQSSPPLQPSGGGQFEIEVKVSDQQGKYKTRPLEGSQKQSVQRALDSVRVHADQTKSDAQIFSRQGTVLRVDKDGIYKFDANTWVRLDVGTESQKEAIKVVETLRLKKEDYIRVTVAGQELKEVTEFARPQVNTLASTLNHILEQRTAYTKRLGDFMALYKSHRELFEKTMHKHGISNQESTFIFNAFTDAHEALEEWYQKFQGVVDLANKGQLDDAVKVYSKLILQEYPKFFDRTQKVIFCLEKFLAPSVAAELKKLGAKLGMQNPGQAFQDLGAMLRLVHYPEEDYKGCLEAAKGIEVEHHAEVDLLFKTKGKILNQERGEYARLAAQDKRLMEFFYYDTQKKGADPALVGLWKADPTLKKVWTQILGTQKWTLKQREEYADLMNKYAAVVQPLKEIELAIAHEANTTKKRALEAQRKAMAQDLSPIVNQLEEKFEKLGGIPKLQTLQTAAYKFMEHFKAQLIESYRKFHLGVYKFASVEDMITELPLRIASLEPQEKGIAEKTFANELALIDRYNLAKSFKQEADSLVILMDDRRAYLDDAYKSLDFGADWEFGQVDKQLLHGPLYKDVRFQHILTEKGWKEANLKHLNTWYDAYIKAFLPVLEAKKAWEGDSENILLQREYRKVVQDQVSKLTELTEEFNDKIGKAKLADLETAFTEYTKTLTRERADWRKQGDERAARRIPEIDKEIALIREIDFIDFIHKTDELIAEAVYVTDGAMSWDKGYMNQMIGHDSQLFEVKEHGKNSVWEAKLKANGVEKKDLAAAIKLHEDYQKELSEINELERKLEAHPNDKRTRDALIRQLKEKRETLLTTLDDRFEALGLVLEDIQAALLAMNDYLIKAAAEIKTNPQNRKAKVGKLSDEEIQGLIRFTGRFNIAELFRQKLDFLYDTYHSFEDEVFK